MATLNTTCPVCGAPHAKKLSTIYQEGFSNVTTNISTVGTLNTIGRQTVTTTGSASSVQQTQASKDAAPPTVPDLSCIAKSYGVVLILAGLIPAVLGLVTWVFVSPVVAGVFASVGIAVMGIGLVMTVLPPSAEEVARHEKKKLVVEAAKDEWAKTFQCGACNHRFVPVELQTA